MKIVHELKVHIEYFNHLKSGIKDFEVRRNDRDYKLGDELLLKEYNPVTQSLTGNFIHRLVVYILEGGQFGVQKGYIVMGLKKI